MHRPQHSTELFLNVEVEEEIEWLFRHATGDIRQCGMLKVSCTCSPQQPAKPHLILLYIFR